METRAHYVLIGLFTLAAGAALLLFILWLARYGTERDVVAYDIIFREPVSGLSVGSPVQYSGIRVGEVESLRLDPEDPGQVRARVQLITSAPVREDTRATLTLLNITGASAIALSEGSPGSASLSRAGGRIPTIESEPSPLTRLRINSDELMVSVTTLLENANRMLSEENAQRMARILDNLDDVSSNLAGQQDALAEGLETLVESGQQLNQLLSRLDQQLEAHGDELLSSAGQTLENIQQLSLRLDSLLAENSPLINNGLQSMQEVGPMMRDLRGLISSLRTVSSQLEDNPTGFLLGNEPIREFQP